MFIHTPVDVQCCITAMIDYSACTIIHYSMQSPHCNCNLTSMNAHILQSLCVQCCITAINGDSACTIMNCSMHTPHCNCRLASMHVQCHMCAAAASYECNTQQPTYIGNKPTTHNDITTARQPNIVTSNESTTCDACTMQTQGFEMCVHATK